LLGFGILGFLMVKNGFPLTPMVLGVVLGPLAELNFGRAVSTSDDYWLFVTRPWALFFIILALFSAFFPLYQAASKAGKSWARYYGPAFMGCAGLPLLLMDGWFRTALGSVMIVLSLLLFLKKRREAA
jgi:putative tricarboxylic transport membrane protein